MLNSLVERQRGLKDRLLSKKLGAKANYECRTFRYIFFAVTARKRRERLYNHVSWRTKTHQEEFSFLFPKLGGGIKNSTLGKFTHISR